MSNATQVRPDIEEGTDLEQVWAASEPISDAAVKSEGSPSTPPRLDYFINVDGSVFAGRHLLVDCYDARCLDDMPTIEAALVAAARAAGATVLSTDFHYFQPNGGVSGVVVLAESHISIHTWPEAHFAALDVFMCGACDPHDTLGVMREVFAPRRLEVREIRRGPMGAVHGAPGESSVLRLASI